MSKFLDLIMAVGGAGLAASLFAFLFYKSVLASVSRASKRAHEALNAEIKLSQERERGIEQQRAELARQLSELTESQADQSAQLARATETIAEKDQRMAELELDLARQKRIAGDLKGKLSEKWVEAGQLHQKLTEAISTIADVSQKILAGSELRGYALERPAAGELPPPAPECALAEAPPAEQLPPAEHSAATGLAAQEAMDLGIA